MIRDKLVSKLKEKEKQKVEHFGERIKNAKETNQLSSDDEGSLEEISEDDVRKTFVCNDFITKFVYSNSPNNDAPNINLPTFVFNEQLGPNLCL